MKQLEMKDCLYPQHIPGLGHFKPGESVEVTDEQIEEYEKATKTKVKDRFDVKSAPVEKKDTPAKKEEGGES